MKHILRPYQVDAVEWFTEHRRGILYDDPGLGKTFSAIQTVRINNTLPCLVVAPAYLVSQWLAFLRDQFGETYAQLYDPKDADPPEFSVISLQQIRKIPLAQLRSRGGFPFRSVIFDEAHRLSNRKSQQSKAALEIATARPHLQVLLLTATPIRNTPDDIFHLLRIVEPTNEPLFHSYYRFVSTFMNVVETPYATKPVSIKKAKRQAFKDLVSKYAFGRTYKEVGRQLPPIITAELIVDFDPQHRVAYREIKRSYRIGGQPLAQSTQLVTLRSFTSLMPVKLRVLRQLFDDALHNRPTVVFVWYKETAGVVMDVLKEAGLSPILATGDQTPTKRAELLRNAWPQPVVATIPSVSEGIDLSRYRAVIFYEEDWTPTANYQALSRVVRDRNDEAEAQLNLDEIEPVLVYHLMAKHSVDVTIHRAASKRGATADSILYDELSYD